MEKCGFTDVKVLSEKGMGPDWLRLYPFFTPEFLDLMFASIPEQRHHDTVLAVFAGPIRVRRP